MANKFKTISTVYVDLNKTIFSLGFFACAIITAILCLTTQGYSDHETNINYSVYEAILYLDWQTLSENGIANIPIAQNENNSYGVTRTLPSAYGIGVSDGYIYIYPCTEQMLIDKNNNRRPITPNLLDFAVKQGLINNSLNLSSQEIASVLAWLGFPAFPDASGTYVLQYDNTGSTPAMSWVSTS